MKKMINMHHRLMLLLLLFLATIGILVQFYFGFSWMDTSGHTFASDDAFITYRYAENLFEGNGAYFNSGERVEGYSNFLYLLLMLPGFLFDSNHIYIYSIVLNTFIFYIVIYTFLTILQRSFDINYALLGIGLLGFNPAVWANITTGLETILIMALFMFFWVILESKRDRFNTLLMFLVSSLSMLARVDGFIFPLIASFYLLLRNEKKLGINLIFYTIGLMAVYAMARYCYYDDVIANTYYAKVSGSLLQRIWAGWVYLYEQTFFNGIAFYALFIIFYLIKSVLSDIRQLVSFPMVFFFVWTSYLIYIGGDIYFERFLLPILPIGIYYFIDFLKNKTFPITIFLVLLAFGSSYMVVYSDGRFQYQNKTYDMWIHLGKFLKQTPSDYTLAIDAAGKVPYFSKLQTIDMLGLNNKKIGKMAIDDREFKAGHTKFDAEYTLSLSPNLIAAWIDTDQNMAWGITKEKYEKNYHLKYLVNSGRRNLQVNMYDVELLDPVLIDYLIQNKFNYAVLVRKDSLAAMPSLSSKPSLHWNGADLPSRTGEILGQYIRAESGRDRSGYITFGPYVKLPEGDHQFDLSYMSPQSNQTAVGTWDVAVSMPPENEVIRKGVIYGSGKSERHIIQNFDIPKAYSDKKVEIRTMYNGIGTLTIKALTIDTHHPARDDEAESSDMLK